MNPSRRAFLVTGIVGGAVLAAGGWLRLRAPRSPEPRALDADAREIVAALVPALLAGALPADPPTRTEAIAETVAAVDGAIAGLPPDAQAELAQLFGLLAVAPARAALGGPWARWSEASAPDVERMLARWQASRLSLLRSAYDGLHQLVLAAWYGNPRSWPAIGYAGPPNLG